MQASGHPAQHRAGKSRHWPPQSPKTADSSYDQALHKSIRPIDEIYNPPPYYDGSARNYFPAGQLRRHEATRRLTELSTYVPQNAKAGSFEEKLPVYGLAWGTIEAFLRRKWPHWKTFNPMRIEDIWHFEVPEKLTEETKENLAIRRGDLSLNPRGPYTPGSMRIPDSPLLLELKNLLRFEWTRQVTCQMQCDQPCSCFRHIIKMDALKAWLTRNQHDGHETNLQLLSEEVKSSAHDRFVPSLRSFDLGDSSSFLVFIILLEQSLGHLIGLFQQSGVNDQYLGCSRITEFKSLRERLTRVMTVNETDETLEVFQNAMWKYYCLQLRLHEHYNLVGTHNILPFCRKVRLDGREGSIPTYWVAVQKDHITEDEMSAALLASLYDDDDFGECYQMLLKSYSDSSRSGFESERRVLCDLHEGPIVKYLGSFTCDCSEGQAKGKTYNILLEYGEQNLYEFWADKSHLPPVRAEEILLFWDSLFEIARTIRYSIIVPQNILYVQGQLKSVVLVRSHSQHRFDKDNSAVSDAFYDTGGTYEAPELSGNATRKRTPQERPLPSDEVDAANIWSFGCILSVTATWIVLGFDGVQQYERFRQHSPACRKDSASWNGFHDGFSVLDEVRNWHNYLRGHLRVSDTTTPLVLDLVEQYMLQAEPSHRHDKETLRKALQNIVEDAARTIQTSTGSMEVDTGVLDAFLSLDADAQEKKDRSKFKPVPLQKQFAAMTEVKKPKQTEEMFGTGSEVSPERQFHLKVTAEGEPQRPVTEETSRVVQQIPKRALKNDSAFSDEALRQSFLSSEKSFDAQKADKLDGSLTNLLSDLEKHKIGNIARRGLSVEKISWVWDPMLVVLSESKIASEDQELQQDNILVLGNMLPDHSNEKIDFLCAMPVSRYLYYTHQAKIITVLWKLMRAVAINDSHHGFSIRVQKRPLVYVTCTRTTLSMNFDVRRISPELEDLIGGLDWLCKYMYMPRIENGHHLVTAALTINLHYSTGPLPDRGTSMSAPEPYAIQVVVEPKITSLPKIQNDCWLPLFHSCMVIDTSLRTWRGHVKGIELSFDLMIELVAAESCLSIGGGIVFVGYQTVLYPVSTDENCAQFHLIMDPDKQINPYTICYGKRIYTDDSFQFKTMRCFVGWCEDAHINLGTKMLSTGVKYSGGRDKAKSLHTDGYAVLGQLGASAPLSAILGLQKNFRFQHHRIRFTPSDNYLKLLQDTCKQPTIVYDAAQGRSWLIPKLSLLLHMSHAYAAGCIGLPDDPIPFVKPHADATELVDILASAGDICIFSEQTTRFLFRELLLALSINLLKTAEALRESSSKKLYGFEFMDVVNAPGKGTCMKKLDLRSESKAWVEIANAVGTVVVCSGIGEAITAVEGSTRLSSTCNHLPKSHDYLAATLPCLARLVEQKGVDLHDGNDLVTIAEKSYWKISGDPFGPCQHLATSMENCWNRSGMIQQVVCDRSPKMLRVNRMATQRLVQGLPKNGAVVFGTF